MLRALHIDSPQILDRTGFTVGRFMEKVPDPSGSTPRPGPRPGRESPTTPSQHFLTFTLAKQTSYNIHHQRDDRDDPARNSGACRPGGKQAENTRVETMGTRVDNTAFEIEHPPLAIGESPARPRPRETRIDHHPQARPQNTNDANRNAS